MRVEDRAKFDTMLAEPPLRATRAARARPAKMAPVATMTDEQEGADFMAFLGEHTQFAASHRGA